MQHLLNAALEVAQLISKIVFFVFRIIRIMLKSLHIIFTICLVLQGCSALGPKTDDHGKRTFGTKLDDRRTQSLAKRNIRAADPALEKAHLDVNTFNGVMIITGQVASQNLVKVASQAVDGMRNVTKVHNELEVAGPTSMIARTNDNWLTTKIKSAMIVSSKADANRIKVVTENGVVYLMGLLTRQEAEAAVRLTRKTYGVQKIVKVFEYIN